MSVRVGVACCLSVALCACGVISDSAPSPANPSSPSAVSLSVSGFALFTATGQTAQLIATIILSDGTSQSVTNSATWQSSNMGVVMVSGTGLVTAVGAGSATITATFLGRSGNLSMTVSLASTPGVYTYTGNFFSSFHGTAVCPPACRITGVMTFATPLGANLTLTSVSPVSFSFSDGNATITQDNATFRQFFVGTDAHARIVGWEIDVQAPSNNDTLTLVTINAGGGSGTAPVLDETSIASGQTADAQVSNNPGVWR